MRKHPGLWRFVVLAGILGTAVFMLSTIVWIGTLDISKLDNPLPEPTYIYDRGGNEASQLSSSRLEPVPLREIPVHLRNAIIAVEDRRFYDHTGIDLRAIFRALVKDVQAGNLVEGGSTITQQLAKNLFLTSEKSLARKWKEAAYAVKIEMTYDKDKILEMYLNQIYFGEGVWGVQEASKTYFGKDVRDLTLSESAMLAGLPKAPTRYSPLQNKEKALERRDVVLSLMREQNYIDEKEYRRAKAEPLRLKKEDEADLKGKYASYVDYVIEEAVKVYGFTEEQLLTGGLRIYTQLDPAVQQAAEDVYADDRFFPQSRDDIRVQSGVAIVDPYTGGVRGIVGYRGERVFRGFNHATQLKRQPGSAFKPLVVYAPALEKGYTPFSMLYDGELNIDGYSPQDWDKQTRGEVSLHEAVVRSWNIPAVWLLNEIGIDAGMEFVKKMGIPLTTGDRNLGIALGGLREGVSPLQMAQAYAAFANLGVMNKAHAITKITAKDGHVLAEAKQDSIRVMSPSTAYTMTLILQDAVRMGTGKNAELPRPTAGKTGTTELPDEKAFAGLNGVKDAWFVGYTPELAAAVWMGYDRTDRQHYLTTSGGAYPAIVFREIMSRALSGVPVSPFHQPEGFMLGREPFHSGDKKRPGQEKHKEKDKHKEKEKHEEKERQKGRDKKKREEDDD